MANVAFLRTRIDFITSCFSSGEVSEIWITFPDPQPQHSRENKRLTSPRFLALYRQIMVAGGIIHLKTDSRGLYDYTCEVVQSLNISILECTDDLYGDRNDNFDEILFVQTHYEKLFSSKGFSIKYLKIMI